MIKNKKPVQLILLLASYLGCLLSPAYADGVHWGRTSFPPFTIIQGPSAGKGVVDRIINFYILALPQFGHHTVNASLTRILEEMKQGRALCHGSLLKKPEREEFADFLLPNMVQFSNGIITTRNHLEQFKPHMIDDITVDFQSLAKDPNLRINYHSNRSYSSLIDRIISDHNANPNASLIAKTGMRDILKDMELITRGRLSGFIGRPAEGFYVSQKLKQADNLIFLAIAGQSKVQPSQIACSKGLKNPEFIKSVNAVTLEHRTSDLFKSYYTQWLPLNIRDEYSALLDEAFKE